MRFADRGVGSLWRALTRDTDLRRRLAVTIGLLAVYWAAAYVPVTGITTDAYAMMLKYGGFDRLSVVALGIEPLMTSLCAATLCNLVARVAGSPETLSPYDDGGHLRRWVLWLCVLTATLSAFQFAHGFEQSPGAVREPGLIFEFACAITMLAGFFLSVWIADRITRRGIGSGLWLLFSAPYVASIYGALTWHQPYFETGAFGGYDLAALAAYCIVPVALIVVLSSARSNAVELQSLLWPPLLATFVMETLINAPLVRLSAWGYFDGKLPFGPSQPLWTCVTVLLILGVATLQDYALERRRSPIARSRAILFTALPGLAVALAHDLMRWRGLNPPVPAHVMIVIVVAVLSTIPLFFRESLRPRWPGG